MDSPVTRRRFLQQSAAVGTAAGLGEWAALLDISPASADEASLLGVAPGTPLLAITRTSSTTAGVPFEFSQDMFRADRTRVTFRTRAERAQIDQLAERPGRSAELTRLPGP